MNIDTKKNLRILVLTSTFPRWKDDTEPGFVYELCKRLHNAGIIVDVLVPHAPGAKKKEIMEGINIYRYQYNFEKLQSLIYSGGILSNLRKNRLNYLNIPFFILSQAIAITTLVKKNKYDLIHAHWIIPQGLICVFIMKLTGRDKPPILCTSHGGDLFALQSALFIKLKKWTLNNVNKITVVSDYMRRICMEMEIEQDKIHVYSMGVDLKLAFRPAVEVSRQKNRIIFVGRLVEKKGVQYLINSIAQLRETIPELELVLVGDGPLRKTLEQQVQQLQLEPNIKFYGSIKSPDLPALYSSANIAVIPSIIDSAGDQEGLGLVIIEAMGCECAVIASDLGAIRQIIDHEENGLLVEPENSTAITTAVSRLLHDEQKRQALASKGRQSVLARYDWETASDNYAALIEQMARQ